MGNYFLICEIRTFSWSFPYTTTYVKSLTLYINPYLGFEFFSKEKPCQSLAISFLFHSYQVVCDQVDKQFSTGPMYDS